VGRKKIDLDYKKISQEYLDGAELVSLGTEYSVSQWTLLKRFKELGIRKTTKRFLNKKAFANFTCKSCYWAGFIAADGWINRGYHTSVELSLKDRKHLKKLRIFLKSNAEIKERTRKRFGKIIYSVSIQFNSIELVKNLESNFNITANKSLSYQPPKLPPNMIRHFIRGYIDGDGSIGWHKHNNKPRLNVCSGSKILLEWIFKHFKENIEEIGNPSIKKRETSELYTIEFMGHQVTSILNWLYEDSEVYLDRKYQKFLGFNV
jgi:hypothetical protein